MRAWNVRFLVGGWVIALSALVATLGGGCGSKDSGPSVTTYTCTPACPSGQVCGASGCVPASDAGVPIDLAAPTPDLFSCPPETPIFAGGQCVVCMVDGDCPGGSVCRSVGTARACLPGCRDDARCAALKVDGGTGSQVCCGGACVDTTRDPSNCGACGTACMTPNAFGACSGGACAFGGCNPGWGDCDGNAQNGCETSLRSDARNCTACGMACLYANGVGACSDGCYLSGCDFGFDDCDGDPKTGCETSTVADKRNCGGCGISCAAKPHAAIDCVNANCQLTKCDQGWSDCNGLPDDGCETNTGIDLNNCGRCNNSCGMNQVCKNSSCTCQACNIPNAKTKCLGGACVFDVCLDGYGDCNFDLKKDGCETDLTADTMNCGACGHACPMNQPYCNAGVCTSNPCTGVVGGHIIQTMGMPYLGFCWYLGAGGASCDQVCADSGGTNVANDAVKVLMDDCTGGMPGQPSQWFYDNGNACGWTGPYGAPATSYRTLGHGYNNMSLSRLTKYFGRCDQGGILGAGTFPGDPNDSVADNNSRCDVCACDH